MNRPLDSDASQAMAEFSRQSSEDPAKEPAIPPRLAEAIRAAHRVELPAADRDALDAAVLGIDAARLRRRSVAGSGVLWRIGAPLAAAAGLAIAVWAVWPSRVAGVKPSAQITILDAFKLAKLIEARERGAGSGGSGGSGGWIDTAWDVTGDGVIDRRDVDALAARAVRLSIAAGAGGGGT